MTFLVREAKSTDLARLSELYRELIPDDVAPGDNQLSVFKAMLQTPGMHVLVAVDGNDQTQATATLIIVPNLTRGGRPFALLENIVTALEHRRRGLAKVLVQRALAIARERQCYKVSLSTSSTDPATHAFYANLGFFEGRKRFYQLRME